MLVARLPTYTMQRSGQITMFTEEISRSVQIMRSAEACYDAYSQLERIPEWCTMLGQIKVVSPTRSEWSPRLPTALARVLPTIQWTSDQCLDPEACTIEWQSIKGIDNCGRAEFEPVSADECTLTLTIQYTLPNWLQPVVTSPPARAFVGSTINTTVEQFKTIIEAEGEAEAAGADGELADASARMEALMAEQRRVTAAASLAAAVSGSDAAVLAATVEEAAAADVDGEVVADANARLEALRAEVAVSILPVREGEEADAAAAAAAWMAGAVADTEPAEPAEPSAPVADARVYSSTVSAEIEIACSASEACAAYSDIEKFPSYVPLLKSVCVVGEGRSEWELQLPRLVARLVRVVGMGRLIRWEASYSVDEPHRLTWQSLSGFENAGVATFEPLGDERCRTVVSMNYSVPLTLRPLESSRWMKRLMSSTMRGAMEEFQSALEADGQIGNVQAEEEI